MNTEARGGGETFLARFKEARRRSDGGWTARRWATFLAELDLLREAFAAEASGEVAFGAADHITRAIESSLVQPLMIEEMAAEARRFFAQAEETLPEHRDEVTARWARLEIITDHPKTALEILDWALAHAGNGSTREELIALQEEAWFALVPT
jgi:hypothetical protein